MAENTLHSTSSLDDDAKIYQEIAFQKNLVCSPSQERKQKPCAYTSTLLAISLHTIIGPFSSDNVGHTAIRLPAVPHPPAALSHGSIPPFLDRLLPPPTTPR